ncbi:phage antirepressor [Nocardia farcinica]|uniref:phage antirepressor n=1 Tax=Nocardia farcinica TaxID=37329 RepID=UPI00245389D3|nr:phage antirepressor [Nocardia farcinica]
MSADLMPFKYGDTTVRTVVIDGEPWFVLADLCRVLDLTNPTMVADRLESDALSTAEVIDSMGRTQQARIVSESGMYEVIFLSRKPEARLFRRWVTAEVIPSIRKTGAYATQPALTEDELIHRALEVSARRVAQLTEKVAELEPKAQVAAKLLDAEGDLSVRDAAQALTRAGVKTGQQRLFSELASRRWISRAGDGRWRVLQYAIDHGFMSVLPQSHYHPKTGELVLDPPQPRVTPKGLQRLLSDLSPGGAS